MERFVDKILTSKNSEDFCDHIDDQDEEQSLRKRVRISDETLSSNSRLHHPNSPLPSLTMHNNHLCTTVIGLQNKSGNDCFMSATIQCLASTPLFSGWIINEVITKCEIRNQNQFCSVCELSQVVRSIRVDDCDNRVWTSPDATSIPFGVPVDHRLYRVSSEFIRGQQQDASLFLLKLLGHLAECLNPCGQSLSKLRSASMIIEQIFDVGIQSTIECSNCSSQTIRTELSYMLSVAVNNMSSLTDALKHFFKCETLTDENAYDCRTCDDLVSAKKQLAISQSPPVLIINLKRSVNEFNTTRKLLHEVQYSDKLDISTYLTAESISSDDSNQWMYYLYAVIAHKGVNLESGHYFAYIRTKRNTWMMINDEHCQQVLLNDILNHKSAYVLFYARIPDISSESRLLKVLPSPQWKRKFSDEDSETLTTDLPRVNGAAGVVREYPPAGYTESRITIEKRRRTSGSSHASEPSTDDDTVDETVNFSDQCRSKQADCRTLVTVAAGVDVEEVYEEVLPSVHKFQLTSSDLLKLKEAREEELKKKNNQKLKKLGLNLDLPSSKVIFRSKSKAVFSNHEKKGESTGDTFKDTKVNIEYLLVLMPYLKHYNFSCGLCVRTRYFGQNKVKLTSILTRCVLKCNGKKCPFECVVHVWNSGSCFVTSSNPNIFHLMSERVSRPIRGSKRREIMEKLQGGGSVYRVHAQYSQKRTLKEKKAFNYDTTGKSRAIFKKIKAEGVAATLLAPDIEKGILKLYDQLMEQVNSDGVIKGILQEVQLRPFCVISYSEASIRLYDALAANPNTVLSWDATGGIIKNRQSSKQILYYELTLAHPDVVKEDTLIPLTYMLSESQSLFTVVQWLTSFKESYKKVSPYDFTSLHKLQEVFPHKKNNFARPAVILSDRAQVFLQAALRVFNEETYDQFLSRAYRIVTNQASSGDLSKTNIHACLAHFTLDMRKLVNRYLSEEIRELGMWSMALLINTSTWKEMLSNWKLICLVFWNYGNDSDDKINRHYSSLLSRIQSISNDPNSNQAVCVSKSIISDVPDAFTFDDENECCSVNVTKTSLRKVERLQQNSSLSNINRVVFDEEQEFNQIDSSFKQEMHQVFEECCGMEEMVHRHSNSNVKANKGARDWLTCIMRNHVPTIPIWSNLLLRNYPQQVMNSVKSFDQHLLTVHDQRTNAVSERRMCIVKRTQLGTQTYVRSDVVLRILAEDLQRMTEAFAVSLMVHSAKENSSSQLRRLRELSEHWNKSNRRGYGRYTKEPAATSMTNLCSSLIDSSTDINDDLSIPNLSAPTWLNLAIGLLLSIKTIRQSPPRSTSMRTPLLIDVANFIESWCLHSEKIRSDKKKNRTQTNILNTQFIIPSNVPSDTFKQPIFLLHNILLPIIAKPMTAMKTYHCIACKYSISKYAMVDHIPINRVDGQLLLRNELLTYFNSSTSDVLCCRCSNPMNRNIQLLDCPSVIVISVNDISAKSVVPRKPPHTLSLANVMDPMSMVSPLSANFDIICFLSIVHTNGSDKLVLATRIKQRWHISSSQKLVGESELLCHMFSRSRIIILERLHQSNANFLHAIVKCCSIHDVNLPDVDGTYETLRDAVREIEKNANLVHVRQNISPTFSNYFQCSSCQRTSDLLVLEYDCVSIYQQNTEDSTLTAIPFIWNTVTSNKECPYCFTKLGDMLLNPFQQTHQHCPNILMLLMQKTSRQHIKNIRLSLSNNEKRTVYAYIFVSVLLVDQYNFISLIQSTTQDRWTVYCEPPYSIPTAMSDTEMDDLFVTAESAIIFLKKVENVNDCPRSLPQASSARAVNKQSLSNRANTMPKFFVHKRSLPQSQSATEKQSQSSVVSQVFSSKSIAIQRPLTIQMLDIPSTDPMIPSRRHLVITCKKNDSTDNAMQF